MPKYSTLGPFSFIDILEQFFRSSGYGMVWGNNFNLFQGMLTVGYPDGTTILYVIQIITYDCNVHSVCIHTGPLGFLDRNT